MSQEYIPEIAEIAKFDENQEFTFVDNSNQKELVFDENFLPWGERFQYAYIPSKEEIDAHFAAMDTSMSEEQRLEARYEMERLELMGS